MYMSTITDDTRYPIPSPNRASRVLVSLASRTFHWHGLADVRSILLYDLANAGVKLNQYDSCPRRGRQGVIEFVGVTHEDSPPVTNATLGAIRALDLTTPTDSRVLLTSEALDELRAFCPASLAPRLVHQKLRSWVRRSNGGVDCVGYDERVHLYTARARRALRDVVDSIAALENAFPQLATM